MDDEDDDAIVAYAFPVPHGGQHTAVAADGLSAVESTAASQSSVTDVMNLIMIICDKFSA